MEEYVYQSFIRRFGTAPVLAVSPGRINLIGEHTDYNEGFVLPGAVDFRIALAAAPAAGSHGTLIALDLDESCAYDPQALAPVQQAWANYPLGVLAQLAARGIRLPAIDLMFSGNIPVGGGMSSSAALEAAVLVAASELFGLTLSRMEMAKAGQMAEHTYAGVRCGIMDQFAVLHGQDGHVLRLDCRSLEYQAVPFHAPGMELLLFDSKVKHALAGTEYNTRRAECEAGVEVLRQQFPEVRSLRDASPEMLEACRSRLSGTVYRRCSFVVAENARVLAACDALERHQTAELGRLMNASHDGLQHSYEVSCPELDLLAHEARRQPGVAGGRMMGGGFGGCTINLVEQAAAEAVTDAVSRAFGAQFGYTPGVYRTQIRAGARIVRPRIPD
ncbi:MAG: galactokinase [Bacteroidia bacterium]|nr:galactokinase [Bacteroidia bacterium]